jgi:hypothetical protein
MMIIFFYVFLLWPSTKGRLYFQYDEAWSIGVHYSLGSWHFVLRYWLVHAIHSQCVLKAFGLSL